MKRMLLLFLLSGIAAAQSQGSFSLTGSQCLSVSTLQKATATYQMTGTWSGTIQPKVSLAGQSAVNTRAVPVASTTPASTVTANGAYFTLVSGYSNFLLCGNTITGTAVIYVNLSEAAH